MSVDIIEIKARVPHQLDVSIGRQLRQRRMKIKMSQAKLGEKTNLTFQQIQKYETGKDKISASRLFQLSQILEVPIEYFFEGDLDSIVLQING
jgi:transcriptional regulator with XRE-family HTH domain